MADNNSALDPLPNGWECRNDPRTRRNYFINYNNKTTTWDDPRANPSVINAPPPYHDPSDIITMQPQMHGTPDHRSVYPSNPAHHYPQLAFHMTNPYMQEILRQEISSYRPSPVPGRAHTAPLMGSHAIGHHNSSKIQETSFSSAIATEQSVAKISAMFPTVSDTHIRALLIKYHSREAVVISALQVEKNPITTPGPFSTPPLARHIIVPPSILPPNYHSTPPSGLRDFTSTPPPSLYSYGYGTTCGTMTGSPASSSCMGSPAFRHSPRPHSSPKMKLRYMKSMFPKADETIILDTLYNVDNNVQAATSQLQAMGFDKRDSTPSRAGTPSSKLRDVDKTAIHEKEKEKSISTPISSARLRSLEEKQKMCSKLKKNYPDLAEQLISMALDSVDYDEHRASHILNIMIKEENTPVSTNTNSASSIQRQEETLKLDKLDSSSSSQRQVSSSKSMNSHSASSILRPNSSKSIEAEASSIGTKTTVEADILARDNTNLKEQSTSCQRGEVIETTESFVTGVVMNNESTSISSTALVHMPPSKASNKKIKGKKDVPKVSRGTSTTEDKEYRSPYRVTPAGPNSAFHHGPNDDLLIEDYVTWAGPEPRNQNRTGLAKGPNKSLLSSQRYRSKGPNRDICKGSQKGLSKGSLYSHLAASNAVTAIVIGESRGK